MCSTLATTVPFYKICTLCNRYKEQIFKFSQSSKSRLQNFEEPHAPREPQCGHLCHRATKNTSSNTCNATITTLAWNSRCVRSCFGPSSCFAVTASLLRTIRPEVTALPQRITCPDIAASQQRIVPRKVRSITATNHSPSDRSTTATTRSPRGHSVTTTNQKPCGRSITATNHSPRGSQYHCNETIDQRLQISCNDSFAARSDALLIRLLIGDDCLMQVESCTTKR